MLNVLARKIHANAVSKGFYDEPINTPAKLMLIVKHLSEALEEDRLHHMLGLLSHSDVGADCSRPEPCEADFLPIQGCKKCPSFKPVGFAVELADALIKLLDLMAAFNIDIDEVVALNMNFNESRDRMHGKAY